MTKLKTKVRAFASYHPATGINSYWVRSQAKEIRGEPGTSENKWWRDHCIKRGWRVVSVIVTLESPVKRKRPLPEGNRGEQP